jgi:hypothetical protein
LKESKLLIQKEGSSEAKFTEELQKVLESEETISIDIPPICDQINGQIIDKSL